MRSANALETCERPKYDLGPSLRTRVRCFLSRCFKTSPVIRLDKVAIVPRLPPCEARRNDICSQAGHRCSHAKGIAFEERSQEVPCGGPTKPMPGAWAVGIIIFKLAARSPARMSSGHDTHGCVMGYHRESPQCIGLSQVIKAEDVPAKLRGGNSLRGE